MKRSRYTATITQPDGEVTRHVILAYSAEGARTYYAARFTGASVQVSRGDYRAKAHHAEVKAAGGFVIDRQALADACDLLGLKLPVKIRYNARVGTTNGNYQLRAGWHDIMLKSYHTAEQASSTLWHELTHAMQAERAGDFAAWRQVRAEQARYSYRIRPIEREACAMSDTMADVLLCKPANITT
jgi:hypothetical protein